MALSTVIPRPINLAQTHLAGALKGGERRGLSNDTAFFLHGLESFDKFWQDLGAASGSELRVDARAEKAMKATLSLPWSTPDDKMLVFTARRE